MKSDEPKDHVRNLEAALEEAQGLVLEVCRCGHLDSEHVYRRKASGRGIETVSCSSLRGKKKCACTAFYPAPLRVEVVR